MLNDVQDFLNAIDKKYGNYIARKSCLTSIGGEVCLNIFFEDDQPLHGQQTIEFNEEDLQLHWKTVFDEIVDYLDHDILCASVALHLKDFVVSSKAATDEGYYDYKEYTFTNMSGDTEKTQQLVDVFKSIFDSSKPFYCTERELDEVFGSERKQILLISLVGDVIRISMRDLTEEETK